MPKFKSNEQICTFQVCTHSKALMKVDTMDLSLSNSTQMDLLNATVDHDRQGQEKRIKNKAANANF